MTLPGFEAQTPPAAGGPAQLSTTGQAASRAAGPPQGAAAREANAAREVVIGAAAAAARSNPGCVPVGKALGKLLGAKRPAAGRDKHTAGVIAPEDASDSPTAAGRADADAQRGTAGAPPPSGLRVAGAELPKPALAANVATYRSSRAGGAQAPAASSEALDMLQQQLEQPQPAAGPDAGAVNSSAVRLQLAPSPPPSPAARVTAERGDSEQSDPPEPPAASLVDLPAPVMPRRWVKGANLGSGSFGQVFQGLNCDTGAPSKRIPAVRQFPNSTAAGGTTLHRYRGVSSAALDRQVPNWVLTRSALRKLRVRLSAAQGSCLP